MPYRYKKSLLKDIQKNFNIYSFNYDITNRDIKLRMFVDYNMIFDKFR